MTNKIFILKGISNAYAVNQVIDTPDYWLIPKENGIDYDILPKSSYKLEVVDAKTLNSCEVKGVK